MPSDAPRPLRADAARNSEKILRAARQIYAERGPDASLEEIAHRAGVGIATLYRRFPDKAMLVRSALDQAFAEVLAPAIREALDDDDPGRGLARVIETLVSLTADNYNTIAAAHNSGASTLEATARFFESLAPLLERAQRAGLVRGDLVLDDLRRIMTMLVSVLWTLDPREGGWRRYVALVLDGLSPEAATPLPPPAPLLVRRPST